MFLPYNSKLNIYTKATLADIKGANLSREIHFDMYF